MPPTRPNVITIGPQVCTNEDRTMPQPEDDAAEHRHVTRADLVLPAAGEDHGDREGGRGSGKGQHGLGLGPMPLPGQGLAHDAPGVEGADDQIDAERRDDHGPAANWGRLFVVSYEVASFDL